MRWVRNEKGLIEERREEEGGEEANEKAEVSEG